MKKAVLILSVFFAAGGCLAPKKQYVYHSFQLVYHSDTRGYVQPCG